MRKINDRERVELEYYRQIYNQQSTESQHDTRMGYSGVPAAAQDALSDDEQMAFWPDDLDYDPKWEINRRHIRSYSGWNKQGQQ